MVVRKIFLFLGLLIALLSGGSIYYLYHYQTKEITILQIKSNLNHAIVPGTKITNDLLEPKITLQKDLPRDPVYPGDVGDNVYASKYLYPSDPLLVSKTTDQPLAYKNVNQRVVSIKPADLGLMGLIQLNDYISIVTPTFSLDNVKVIGVTDTSGNILSVAPQFSKSNANNNYLQNLADTAKNPDHLLILVSKEDADIISKLPKDSITVVFDSRPSLPDSK